MHYEKKIEEKLPELAIISETTIALVVPKGYTKVDIFYDGQLLKLDLPEKKNE